jgi:hypothetical protein
MLLTLSPHTEIVLLAGIWIEIPRDVIPVLSPAAQCHGADSNAKISGSIPGEACKKQHDSTKNASFPLV